MSGYADRFLTWLFFNKGVCLFVARRLTVTERNAYLTEWLKAGKPYAYAIETHDELVAEG